MHLRDDEKLDIETEALDGLTWEYRIGRVGCEELETALSVVDAGSGEFADETFGERAEESAITLIALRDL